MDYKFLEIYDSFFTKHLSFHDFMNEMDDYIDNASNDELQYLYDYTTDYPFFEFDKDMVMLTYIYLWLIPNRMNLNYPLSGADNMYLSFIRSLKEDCKITGDVELISDNFMNMIYIINNYYLILNISDIDLNISLPNELINKKAFCINCNEELELKNTIELYPYGFMILEIIKNN